MIDEILLQAFAQCYDPPHLIIEDFLRDGSLEIRSAIETALDAVAPNKIESLDHDSRSQCETLFTRGGADLHARLYIVCREVASAIQVRRLALVTNGSKAPYDHRALQDLTADGEGLVPLAEFEIDGDALCRRGTAFFVLPPVPGANANYWLLNELQRSGLANSVRVRLDPLLFGRADTLGGRFYRATVYGRALDWPRIRGLRETEHGRWTPGRLSRSYLFTDYAWIPHDSEVDFICEELPVETDISVRGSRYLHAIYDKSRHEIKHLDGAIRVLSQPEFATRVDLHVRNAGKAGTRVKIFRIDGAISTGALSSIAQGFFFWNHDVARYFGAPIHADL